MVLAPRGSGGEGHTGAEAGGGSVRAQAPPMPRVEGGYQGAVLEEPG